MAGMRTRLVLRLRRSSAALRGALAAGTIRLIRAFDADAMAGIAAAVMRRIGPWLPEHRIGRENLAAAFPDKSPAEIEAILRGVWDNLGRVAAEFAHIDRLWDYDPVSRRAGRILDSDDAERIALRLRDDGRPALVFSAHLANWELAAVGAHSYGVDTTVLYRRPNLRAVADLIVELRSACMGTLVHTSLDAPAKLADALERGSHVAMLVDQYNVQGVPVTFFGRPTKANPMLARLARHFDCPIHGIRMVRHPGNRFQLRLTEAIEPARDAEGKVDVAGTMQIVTDVVEGWIREHPDQWLWIHRRWR
jgi:Kdo2-lipid IVA lauroyltransferase/acyltransferase